ncbi:hypothetical protein CAEBREN_08943 [Caenorhabditis brenneri]|uniref:F-box domain-containing protein n=1 Tax=Caenorhabditis brenneri TaxID=135651 RepID=G0N2C2_CAEBE|nr:hypothetical protein CAEBREN_08943 [Caenorhabditis brenneri]
MGLSYSKLFKTTPNSSNPSCNAYSPTEYSSVPTAKNLPLHPFYNLKCLTKWSPTAKTFPLLRLPFFALLEVFKSLDPIELFILSQCSRKIANCVHIGGTKKWKLSVDVGHKQIIINNTYRLLIIETPQKPSWKYDEKLKTFFLECQFSRNNKLEFQQVLSKVQAAFKCPVSSFAYTGWGDSDECWFSVIKHISQNQAQPLESLGLRGWLKTEDLEWVFQDAKVTRIISIRTITSRLFRPDLMMFKSCEFIELNYSWLSINDLNDFMEEWKAGNLPSLRYMGIGSDVFHSDDLILGFKKDEMKQLGVRRRLVIDENLSVDCTGGVDIQSDNGTKATMQMNREVPDRFELFVWII